MKKKLTTLLFGLLIAVGWTSSASAQLMAYGHAKPGDFKYLGQPSSVASNPSAVSYEEAPDRIAPVKGARPEVKAPLRANYTVESPAVHEKQWYIDLGQYIWYPNGNTDDPRYANVTEPASDPYQIWSLVRAIYATPDLPGIKYSKPKGKDHEYLGCDFGWWVSGDLDQDITIDMTAYMNISYIGIYDFAGNLIQYNGVGQEYDASTTYINNMPSGWTRSSYLNRDSGGYLVWSSTGNSNAGYNPTTAITISKNNFAGKGGVQVLVRARRTRSNASGFSTNGGRSNAHYCYAVNYSRYGEEKVMDATSTWENNVTIVNGPVTPPTEAGYTVLIVKLKDTDENGNLINNNTSQRAPLYTPATSEKSSTEVLIDYLDTYVDEVQLLTDGLRVGQDDGNGGLIDGGTMFSYSGTLNRFFFISKGKMAYLSGSENRWAWSTESSGYTTYYYYDRNVGDRAPFYNMYEEFSPETQESTTGQEDFYASMVNGEKYPIIHDCNSVTYMQHYFSMTGKNGTDPKSMSSLVFFIPDERQTDSTGTAWRNYDKDYQPQVGLYTIHLGATAVPTPNVEHEYTVTLDWTSSLNGIVDNQVPQTYDIYIVVYDENGNIVEYKYLDTTEDVTTYTYTVPQYETSYSIYYIVKGHPTEATNPDQFYTWSNIDDVTIPGWFDFLKLEKDHVESDFDVTGQKNYYRNYLYPTNLAPNTGMTLEQLKQEWPADYTAKYTIYRDQTGIAVLEVRAVGKKVYYRIKYYRDTQVTDGLNVVNGLNIQYVD